MMTYKKARGVQSIIIFSSVILIGTVISVVSKLPKKGEVEGVQDENVEESSDISDFNEIPIFKSEPPINGYVGEIYSYYVAISDSDSVDLTLSLVKGPAWLSVDGLEVHGVPFEKTSMSGEKVVLEISDGTNSSYQTYYLNIVEKDEI